MELVVVLLVAVGLVIRSGRSPIGASQMVLGVASVIYLGLLLLEEMYRQITTRPLIALPVLVILVAAGFYAYRRVNGRTRREFGPLDPFEG